MTSSPLPPPNWAWARNWALAILLLSGLPYLIVFLATPDGWHYSGLLVNPYDSHSYLAKMGQGFEGNWLFHLTYTPEPHAGAFIFTFYLALGHLAAWLHLPLPVTFHLARLLAGFGLLWVAFRFITHVTPDPKEQRLAFILLLTASGLGWLGVFLGAFPIDLWVPEAFVPYSLYANPHFPMGMALMLIIFQRVIWPPPVSPVSLMGSGLAGLALAMILPFALLTAMVVLGVYLIWCYSRQRSLPWSSIWHTLAGGLGAAPVILYAAWVSITNPILAGWSAQNVTPAPDPVDLILGYGPVGLLAIGGGWFILKKRPLEPAEGFLLIWAGVTIALVYLPFDLQRRFITGLHLPLCLLAALGIRRWLESRHVKPRRQRHLTAIIIAVGAVGTLFVWSLYLINGLQAPTASFETGLLFLRDGEVETFNWLHENSQAEDVVLASPRLGAFIPARTGARAFYGHPFETVDAEARQATAEAFYRGELADVPPPVDFIIYGPSERAIGRPDVLATYPVVFATGDIEIYKVTR